MGLSVRRNTPVALARERAAVVPVCSGAECASGCLDGSGKYRCYQGSNPDRPALGESLYQLLCPRSFSCHDVT